MSDQELIEFGKSLAKLSKGPTGTANPFQQQLDEARAEWKRRMNEAHGASNVGG
jgi:hypothetical protein